MHSATPDHPFYTADSEWVAAGALWVGDSVFRADGASGVVESLEVVQQAQPMYNLTVDEAHTFFVGDGAWLVHNTCGPGWDRPYNAREWRDHLEAKYGSDNVTSTTIPRANDSNVALAGQQSPNANIWFDPDRGFPVFDRVAAYDTRIDPSSARIRDRNLHNVVAMNNLRADIEGGMPHGFSSYQLQMINTPGEGIVPGYTWHHHQDVGRMQLVPSRIHRRLGHIGGFSLWEGR